MEKSVLIAAALLAASLGWGTSCASANQRAQEQWCSTAQSPPTGASGARSEIGIVQLVDAGTAARALRAAAMSPAPWDKLPANQRVDVCFQSDGRGGTAATFVDGLGHVTPAPNFPARSCPSGTVCAGSIFKPS